MYVVDISMLQSTWGTYQRIEDLLLKLMHENDVQVRKLNEPVGFLFSLLKNLGSRQQGKWSKEILTMRKKTKKEKLIQ